MQLILVNIHTLSWVIYVIMYYLLLIFYLSCIMMPCKLFSFRKVRVSLGWYDTLQQGSGGLWGGPSQRSSSGMSIKGRLEDVLWTWNINIVDIYRVMQTLTCFFGRNSVHQWGRLSWEKTWQADRHGEAIGWDRQVLVQHSWGVRQWATLDICDLLTSLRTLQVEKLSKYESRRRNASAQDCQGRTGLKATVVKPD